MEPHDRPRKVFMSNSIELPKLVTPQSSKNVKVTGNAFVRNSKKGEIPMNASVSAIPSFSRSFLGMHNINRKIFVPCMKALSSPFTFRCVYSTNDTSQ